MIAIPRGQRAGTDQIDTLDVLCPVAGMTRHSFIFSARVSWHPRASFTMTSQSGSVSRPVMRTRFPVRVRLAEAREELADLSDGGARPGLVVPDPEVRPCLLCGCASGVAVQPR